MEGLDAQSVTFWITSGLAVIRSELHYLAEASKLFCVSSALRTKPTVRYLSVFAAEIAKVVVRAPML